MSKMPPEETGYFADLNRSLERIEVLASLMSATGDHIGIDIPLKMSLSTLNSLGSMINSEILTACYAAHEIETYCEKLVADEP